MGVHEGHRDRMKREFLQGQGQFLAPYGDMMLAGCFGLLWGWAHRGDDAGRL